MDDGRRDADGRLPDRSVDSPVNIGRYWVDLIIEHFLHEICKM